MPTSPVTVLYHRFDNYAINLYLLIMPREHILALPVRSHSGVVTINLVICLIYRAYFPSIYFGEDNFEKLLEGFRTKIGNTGYNSLR